MVLVGERSPADSVFLGDSEMARLMRATHWERTPLGPVETWPHSLRTVVGLCLTSRYPISIFWGPELVQLYNDAYRPVLGASKHPGALGRAGRITWPEIWDVIGPMFADVVGKGVSFSGKDTLFLLDRHGYVEETYFDFSYDPIRDDDGALGGVFVACQETTERVLADRRMKTLRDVAQAASAARTELEARDLVARAFQANPTKVPVGLLYAMDGAARALRLVTATGVSARERGVPEVVRLDRREEDPWAGAFHDAWSTGTMRQFTLPTPLTPELTGDGMSQVAEAFVLPLPPGQPEPGRLLVVARNPRRAVDDRYREFLALLASNVASAFANAQAHTAERRRADALADLDRAKTIFFSNVSHEFRTPLTLILGPLEDLLAEPDADERRRELLDVAYRNALRLVKLVNGLLDFSRLEAGRMDAAFEPTDLSALTADIASTFRSAMERAGIRYIVDLKAGGPTAYVDREMWEKIVLNLISNAFKSTLAGEVRIELLTEEDSAILRVRDTGVGIAAGDLPRIFERFHRVIGVAARSHEGSGIGLSLARDLARLHGGDVEVESEVGRGSTFTVRIPLGADHLPADHVKRLQGPELGRQTARAFVEEALRWLPGDVPSAPAAATSEGRVLVVDDNADLRDHVSRLLAPRWEIETASNGVEALERVRSRVPDVVVSDVMMPGLDGIGLLRALRANAEWRDIPVILLSARADVDAKVGGLEIGADDYVVKPFSASELVARVGAQLSRARERRRALELERELADRLAQIVDHMPEAVALFDAEGRLVIQNRAAEELIGSGPRRGGEPHPLRRIDGRALPAESHPLRRALAGETVRGEPLVVSAAGGDDVTVLVSSAAVRGASDKGDGAVLVYHDVTALASVARLIASLSEMPGAAGGLIPAVDAGDLRIDLVAREVTRAGERIQLTATERALLYALVTNAGTVMRRDILIDLVWGPQVAPESNLVDYYVQRVRRKLGDDARAPRYIETVPGQGYRFMTPRD